MRTETATEPLGGGSVLTLPIIDSDAEASPPPEDDYPLRRVLLGGVGRIWLWFLIGCLTISVLPLVIGWSSFLIESGSMRPNINAGDVVITSPDPQIEQIGGRVITFDSPTVADQVITHRVVELSDTGEIRTKGDANQSPDSATITLDEVRGLGRLLVKYVGLPKLWLQQGDLLPLAGFVVTVLVAGVLVRYDNEHDEGSEGPDGGAADGGSDGDPTEPHAQSFSEVTAPVAVGAIAGAGMATRRIPMATISFVLLASLYVASLTVPTAMAAMTSSTVAPANAWAVPNWDYADLLADTDPWVHLRLDETNNGNQAADSSGNNRQGRYEGGVTKNRVGALTSDTPNRAVQLTNSSSCITMLNGARLTPAPTVYSTMAWFKVPAGYNQGGKILGFESARTGVSDSSNGGQYDRHVYMDGSGRIRFGVWTGNSRTLASPAAYNDGQWHMVATTMGPDGSRLYVDGVEVATSFNTASEVFSNGGWWRFGCGNLAGWSATSGPFTAWAGPNAPTTQRNYPLLGGELDEVVIWQNRVLTAEEIALLYFAR